MAIITKTTRPLDVEIYLPDSTLNTSLSTQTLLHKAWEDTFVSPNPVETQVNFFKDLAIKIRKGDLDVEFYQYWYNKAKTSHPEVAANLTDIVFQQVNDSTGSLYFAQNNIANTPINTLPFAVLPVCPSAVENSLPSGVNDMILKAYTAVNAAYADNIGVVQDSPTTTPTTAHGTSLVKDSIAKTRNTASKPLIKTSLEDKYSVALDLTSIENVIQGDISIIPVKANTNIEGTNVTVDELGNKIEPTLSALSIDTLKAV